MNKQFKISLLVLLTIFAFAGFFFACEQNEPESDFTNENPEFLQLSQNANLNDLSSLTKKDRQTLQSAFYRLKLDELGENEKFTIKSGKEVNISEAIYNFFYRTHSANFIHKRNRKKTNGETAKADSTKCVPYVVHDVLKGFGIDASVNDISNWCYGQGYYNPQTGTQGKYLQDIFEHYFSHVEKLRFEGRPQDYIRETGTSYVAVITSGQYKGHVVMIEFIFDGKIYGSNSQANGDAYKVDFTEIGCVYEIQK